MGNLPKNVALVYDWVDDWGGAERVLLALHELFPQASLFTPFFNPRKAKWVQAFPSVHSSINSRIANIFGHRRLGSLFPLATESLQFDGFEMVISLSSSFAKGIITPPDVFHLCYCLTPPRFIYPQPELQSLVSKPLIEYLYRWDQIAIQRPDEIIAISQTVKRRIEKYYRFSPVVVYPPVDILKFRQPSLPPCEKDYWLIVGRLVRYKQLDRIIRIFNTLKERLLIIGSGPEALYLKSISSPNIKFIGEVSDEKLVGYYEYAKAVLFLHEEDFGLVPVESMAAGTPVIGLNKGGVTETIIPGITGILLDSVNINSLSATITSFNKDYFSCQTLFQRAQLFSKERFLLEFAKVCSYTWQKFQHKRSGIISTS